jgi:L-alanine-DL-glutamate epimerase-like enolase superfamily enzyme
MKLTWRLQTLHLHRPFGISRGRSAKRKTILLEIEHNGIVGRGEAVPYVYYGQSNWSIRRTLRKARPMLGNDPYRIDAILADLIDRFDDQRAAVAGIDSALRDWIGQADGQPVHQQLGLNLDDIPPTSYTIGIDEPDVIAEKVAEAHDYPILKVKVGTDDDERILDAVRQAAPDKKIRVDANAGWSADTAADRIAALAKYDLELIEQPIPPGQPDAWRRLRDASPVPIIADESAVRPKDVRGLVGLVDGINIKLTKCGGIGETLEMIRLARDADLKIMLGCMIESTVGISAAVQISPLVDYVDLDGHLLIANDPFMGLCNSDGRILPNPGPGLGLYLRRSKSDPTRQAHLKLL